MFQNPDISVIVPFFNSEKTIKRCLYSILESRKKLSLEIICIDDGSTDGSASIVRRMMCRHLNIKKYAHKENQGLFQARATGLKHVKGKYIAFVDSDDYVKVDYFVKLYETALQENSDVTVGRIVNVSTEGVHYIQKRCMDFPYTKDNTQKYYEMYWNQAGLCYPWHVIWNKLYKREILEKAKNDLFCVKDKITMLEDFIYSSIVLSKANTYALCKDAYYFYVQNENNVTSQREDIFKWERNIIDMGKAFLEVSAFLCRQEAFGKYVSNLNEWKERYSRYWTRNIIQSNFNAEEKIHLQVLLKQLLQVAHLKLPDAKDEYYYEEALFDESVP